MKMRIELIAYVCHEANKAYCESIGDYTQKHWQDAEPWQVISAIKGVEYALNHIDAPASAQHEAWLQAKQLDGWTYGPVKDVAKKEHPCMVPYRELPVEQQIKDSLFQAIVWALPEPTY